MKRYEKFAELAYRVAKSMECPDGCNGCPYRETVSCTEHAERDIEELRTMLNDYSISYNRGSRNYGSEEVEEPEPLP